MSSSLSIVLSEGFEACPVTIRIGRAIVFQSESVSTRLLTAAAEYIEVEDELASDRPLTVDVVVGGKEEAIKIASLRTRWLTIWIQDSTIHHKLSTEPLGYA